MSEKRLDNEIRTVGASINHAGMLTDQVEEREKNKSESDKTDKDKKKS